MGRKPIRPLERQKMRPWLHNLLINDGVPSMKWESKKDGTFRIAWRHAARQGWNPTDDADLFERWAKHTGKYIEGDEPDPKRWKANFRCALNSLPDVEELKEKSVRKGNNAFKIYRFLSEEEKRLKLKNRKAGQNHSRGEYTPKRISKRLQDKPQRRFAYSESDDDGPMSEDECSSPSRRDSDEISTSGSETEWLSERRCRLSSDSSELPIFEKICPEAALPTFQFEKGSNQRMYENKVPSYSQDELSHTDDDQLSTETDMTEEELVELILSAEAVNDINEEAIDIWSSVAADVTIGDEMETDMTYGCAILTETKNVVTEQLYSNPLICIDPSLV